MYVGPDTMSSMVFMTESEKLSYLDFNPNGRADLIIDSEGNILKKTPVGEKVAGIALSRLSEVVKHALTVTELAIVDGDLEGKINAQKEAQQRQADEVAERKRKKREAAALNF